MCISIRAATVDDHQSLTRIAREINAMHAEALPARFQIAADPLPLDYFQALLNSDEDHVLVAERAGVVVGYAILRIRESPPVPVVMPRRYVLLNDLVVTGAAQGQGIARMLVEASVGWARSRGAAELQLGVYEFDERAIAFYEHLGFTTLKRTMALPVDRPRNGVTND